MEQLLAHAGEPHASQGQSFMHLIAAWYIAVPLFTIVLTLLVALLVRRVLDQYERSHRKAAKKHAKKAASAAPTKEEEA